MFQNYFQTHGIQQQFSCPYTPQQNGLAERKHRHIIETARTLILDANLPYNLWVYAVLTAVYLINRLPSSNLKNKSPHEMLFHCAPNYKMLKVFGCQCYPLLPSHKTHKLAPKALKSVFIGYATASKGYMCLDMDTGTVIISVNVQFHEHLFPFKSDTSPHSCLQPTGSSCSTNNPPPLTLVPLTTSTSPSNVTHSVQSASSLNRSLTPTSSTSASSTTSIPHPSPVSDSVSSPRPHLTKTHHMTTRLQTGHLKPKSIFNLLHLTQQASDPTSYTQAAKCPNWRNAMSAEFQALQQQGTWTLIPPKSHYNVLGNKWLYKTKLTADGNIARYKARLVAQGFKQEYGFDFFETFSPVAKFQTIRVFLTVSLHNNWTITQLDVSNAFLHGSLTDDVYMEQPKGFVDPNYPSYVCKLNKALYGLKQAPRQWFSTFTDYLLSWGFEFSNADPSLLFYSKHGITLYLLIYVDDILFMGNDSGYASKLLHDLQQQFSVKNLGTLHTFLGLQVIHSSDKIFLHQQNYARSILNRAGMTDCHPLQTPTVLKTDTSAEALLPFSDPQFYRSIAGSLQYLTLTRPDIAFAVNQACQHMHHPLNLHFQILKRILRYLNGTLHYGLPILRGDMKLTAYSDADWAGDKQDRKSTTGFCIFLGNTLISWSSKKQHTIARSSTESEYRSLTAAATEIVWLRRLLQDFQFPSMSPTTLFCDNISAMSLANNPVFHARTKHIEIDYHYIRECIKSNIIKVHHLYTTDQTADVFTKGLSTAQFQALRTKLTLQPGTVNLRGNVRISQPKGNIHDEQQHIMAGITNDEQQHTTIRTSSTWKVPSVKITN
ncbi:Retrovirus-related Pol polyprotein from transposon TNT 1-94 [Dendrobium catenatum]|uniref:Retrovirus-related Pol polyprotein from transposon TNT 1-94 n=1 Tax=Dendrobium catenatum TaxID=906689 RepID=A0A2I0WYA6_9ASPA|nr:Retrovirus-related Pol polyprotein from transposon TNT 1-94 [Dendrobium catenatum]